MQKGEPAWNKGMKGYTNSGSFKKCQKSTYGNLGKKRSEEAIIKAKNSNKGFKHSEESKEKCRLSKLGDKNPQYGKIRSEEHCLKISKALKLNHPLRGKKIPEEWRKKLGVSRKGKTYEEIMGIENSQKLKAQLSKSMSLSKNHQWRGGISFLPYSFEFNDDFKDTIRNRDGFKCVKCNLTQEQNKELFNQSLNVHHIDYNKTNTSSDNCCSLCLRCHIETNSNREQWIIFFHSLLNNRYGYIYNTKDIIKIMEKGV